MNAAFSPDVARLAVTNKGVLEVADLRRNEVRFHWKGIGLAAASWSPDGHRLAVAGNGERVIPLVAAALGVAETTGEPVADGSRGARRRGHALPRRLAPWPAPSACR